MLGFANHHPCVAQAAIQVDSKDDKFRKKEASTEKEIRREGIDELGWKRADEKVQK